MPDVQDVPSEAVKSAGSGLSHKLGPLPVWGWVLVGGGVVVVVVMWHNASVNNGGSGVSGILPPGTPFTGGNGTPTTNPLPTEATPLTNTTWLQQVAAQVAAQLQIPESEVRLYLSEYLNGGGPTGSAAASSLFGKVVDAAIGLVPVPNPPSIGTPGGSPYGSQSSWLNDLLSYLPSGTTSSVRQEIQNLANGLTSTLSPAAAYAFEQAQSIVGNGPNAINYVTTPAIDQDMLNKIYGNTIGLPSLSYTSWAAAVRESSSSLFALPDAVLQTIWNEAEGPNHALYTGVNGPANQIALFNRIVAQWLANPTSIVAPGQILPGPNQPPALTGGPATTKGGPFPV